MSKMTKFSGAVIIICIVIIFSILCLSNNYYKNDAYKSEKEYIYKQSILENQYETGDFSTDYQISNFQVPVVLNSIIKEPEAIKYEPNFIPKKITFIVLKNKGIMELWYLKDTQWLYIKDYTILAASGKLGPKLLQGDKQVPEGIYNIVWSSPKTKFHCLLLLDYPNKFDCEMAAKDGRKDLGGEICIHGKSVSIGCVAIGDPASEEVYNICTTVGLKNCKVIISPCDFRTEDIDPASVNPNITWLPLLYENIKNEINKYVKQYINN